MIAPATIATKPSQSPVDHARRRRRNRSLDQTAKRQAMPATSGITTSSPLTAGATAEATTAEAIHQGLRSSSAFVISRKQSAAYGYAKVSSTSHDEYASAGTAPVAAA